SGFFPRGSAQLEFCKLAAGHLLVDRDLGRAMSTGNEIVLLRLTDADHRHLAAALADQRQLLEKHRCPCQYRGKCCRGPMPENGPPTRPTFHRITGRRSPSRRDRMSAHRLSRAACRPISLDRSRLAAWTSALHLVVSFFGRGNFLDMAVSTRVCSAF